MASRVTGDSDLATNRWFSRDIHMLTDRGAPLCAACAAPCAGNEFRARSVLDGTHGTFKRCERCGSLRTAELIDYDRFYQSRASTNFPEVGYPLLIKLKQRYLQQTLRSLLSPVPLQSRILDYGCGGGELANAICDLGFSDVSACDVQGTPPPTLSAQVPYFTPESIRPGDVFDLILMRHVLEHVEDPVALLTGLSHRLSSSGRIMIEVPSVRSIFRIFLGSRWPGYFFPYHVHVFSAQGLTKLAVRSGLVVRDIVKCNPPILGVYLMELGVRRDIARFLSLLLYPGQLALNRLTGRSEAIRLILQRS